MRSRHVQLSSDIHGNSLRCTCSNHHQLSTSRMLSVNTLFCFICVDSFCPMKINLYVPVGLLYLVTYHPAHLISWINSPVLGCWSCVLARCGIHVEFIGLLSSSQQSGDLWWFKEGNYIRNNPLHLLILVVALELCGAAAMVHVVLSGGTLFM